jgi:hypothetical protein
MLNLFQHPSGMSMPVYFFRWTLKRAQGDGVGQATKKGGSEEPPSLVCFKRYA